MMSTFDLDAEHVRHPDWAPDCRCGVCHTCLPVLSIGANIILAEN